MCLKSAQALKYPFDFSKVIWKDTAPIAMSDLNRTADLAFTDLDLTDATSPRAKFALIYMRMRADTVGTGPHTDLEVRKNGTHPTYRPVLALDKAGTTTGVYKYLITIIGLDSGQVIEYRINMSTGWQVDTYIMVLGYIE